jgi:hypothetical protein
LELLSLRLVVPVVLPPPPALGGLVGLVVGQHPPQMVLFAGLLAGPAAARLPPLQDGEVVAQDQDFGGFPRLLAPGRPHPCAWRRCSCRL